MLCHRLKVTKNERKITEKLIRKKKTFKPLILKKVNDSPKAVEIKWKLKALEKHVLECQGRVIIIVVRYILEIKIKQRKITKERMN